MSSGKLRIVCSNLKCRTILNVPITARGKTIRCGQCGFRVRIPGQSEAAPSSPAATPQTKS